MKALLPDDPIYQRLISNHVLSVIQVKEMRCQGGCVVLFGFCIPYSNFQWDDSRYQCRTNERRLGLLQAARELRSPPKGEGEVERSNRSYCDTVGAEYSLVFSVKATRDCIK